MKKTLLYLMIFLASCGGGNQNTQDSLDPHIIRYSGTYIHIDSFYTDKSSIKVGEAFLISWNVNTDATVYYATLYVMNSTNEVPEKLLKGICNNRYLCNLECMIENVVDSYWMSCGNGGLGFLFTATNIEVKLEVCVIKLNTSHEYICDLKSTYLTIIQ